MIGIGLATDDTDAISIAFKFAYVCFAIAAIYSVGYWFSSETYQDLRNRFRRTRKPIRKRAALRRFRIRNYGTCTAIILSFCIFSYFTHRIETTRRLSTFEGTLVPANDPFVEACQGATGNEAIILVRDFAVKFDHWPAVLLRVNGKDRIILDRGADGVLFVSAQIFSNDGKIIADVFRNAFNINKNNIFTKTRIDDSTLKVVDQNNEIALYIRYINRKEIVFDAKLYYPDSGDITILGMFSNLCMFKSAYGPLLVVNKER